MGWSFPWASSANSDFNFDLGASSTEEQMLEQGRIKRLRPRKGHPRGIVCTRGTRSPEVVYSPDRLLYTVIGDEVNLASRLEALNKTYGTRIIVSEATRTAAGAADFAFRAIGEVRVRGRSRPTPVYALGPR